MSIEVVISLVSAAAVLLAGAIVVFCRIRLKRRQVSWEQLRLSYPELDRELDVIWQCLNPTSGS
jgi:hypothetical protein